MISRSKRRVVTDKQIIKITKTQLQERIAGQRSTLITAGILITLLPLLSALPDVQRYVFCLPSALLAGAFTGLACIPADDGYLLLNDALPVYVTLYCSAIGYFTLVLALSCGLIFDTGHKVRWRTFLWIALMSYSLTLIANVTRIVLGWGAGRWARTHLPQNYWGILHTAVGVLVFLFFLSAAYFLLVRRFHHERPC